MKKLFLTIILLCTTCLTYAQGNKWELGIEGGPNESSVHLSSGNLVLVTSPLDEYGPAYHYSFGLTGQYNIGSVFSIKAGLCFERKGFVQKFTFAPDSGSPNFETVTDPTYLDYLVIPILAKVSFGKKTKFFINAGPYFSYLLQAEGKFSYPDSTGKIVTSTGKIKDEYQEGDIGLSGGIGVDVPIGDRWIADLELRGNFGLTNIDFTGFYITQNQSENLLLGLRYKL